MSQDFTETGEDRRAIEIDFPIDVINRNSHREGKSRRTYRPILNMHKWFARRPGTVFRHAILYALTSAEDDEVPANLQKQYLEDLDFSDKTIVDPFMGGGTTIYEALRTNAQVVGTDLNPVAWFITKKGTDDVDIDALDEAYEKVEEEVADDISSYYRTPCRHCDDSQGQSKLAAFNGSEDSSDRQFAEAMNYFWVTSFPCVNQSCDEDVHLFNKYVISNQRSTNDDGTWVICPDCFDVFVVSNKDHEQKCECGFSFTPSKGNYDDGDYFCLECGQDYNVLDALDRFDSHEFQMYAVEYYCPDCNAKEYASLTEFDYSLYDEISAEYENIKDSLPIPDQEIPYGHNTSERNPVTDWYDEWKDMFNKRQLLSHGKIFDAILDIESQNEREYLLLVASNILSYKNMLTIYNTSRNHQEHLYINHAIIPRQQPVEGDIWGQTYGRSTFNNHYEIVRDALEFKKAPKEFTTDSNGEVTIRNQSNQVIRKDEDQILCRSAESIPMKDGEADAVITDPPYYNNIQYAELSDFFYIWLRKGLWECVPDDEQYDEMMNSMMNSRKEKPQR